MRHCGQRWRVLHHFEYAIPENIRVWGIVEESVKNGFLASANLALNPIESGSGTNLKMLDYIAAGLPALTTPFGSRGLGVVDGQQVFVSELIDFPERIRQIREQSPRRLQEITNRARQHVEAAFSWDAIGEKFARALQKRLKV
jgi:glycosyltransferase involved in cell wall biosynthesis